MTVTRGTSHVTHIVTEVYGEIYDRTVWDATLCEASVSSLQETQSLIFLIDAQNRDDACTFF